ncbi:hypothetical protein ES703_20329 [subsurface metagenome]
MLLVMISYYAICIFIGVMLVWNFIREKKNVNDMLLYLLVLIPLILRLLRVK